MLGDYCRCLKRDTPVLQHKRKPFKRPLLVFESFAHMRLYFDQLLNVSAKVM